MSRLAGLVLSAGLGMAVGWFVGALGPLPAADVARGTEEPFSKGLHQRELPPRQGPQRWTRERTEVRFAGLPASATEVEVFVRGHRGPAAVSCDGVLLGHLPPGTSSARFSLPQNRSTARTIVLQVPTFRAGDGRDLGALFDRVALVGRGPHARPSFRISVVFLLPALAAAAAAVLAGLGGTGMAASAVMVAVAQAAALWPGGVVRSAYAPRLAVGLACALLLVGLIARTCARRWPGSGPWALGALLSAVLVQGVAALSPVMVVSDAVFHANVLARVSAGDLFPTSVTQHARPFRFPYGVAYYAVLAPFMRLGAEPVWLVRAGAAAAGLVAAGGLFAMLAGRIGPAGAAAAVVLMQLLPVGFDVAYSYGNLSNAFGQALTLLFFAWWCGGTPFGWALGAALFTTAATAHFSSLVVTAAMSLGLLWADGPRAKDTGARRTALAVGAAAALAYYAKFLPLVLAQLPRLLEGGGQGRGTSLGAWDAARHQALGALGGLGLPVIVLAALSLWPRAVGEDAPAGALEDGVFARRLRGAMVSVALLAVPAVVSPLEVRYLYGLAALVAVSAARGLLGLHARGGALRALGWSLFAAQAVLGTAAIVEAVVRRYRP